MTLFEGWQRLGELKAEDRCAGRGLSHHPTRAAHVTDDKFGMERLRGLSEITQTSEDF